MHIHGTHTHTHNTHTHAHTLRHSQVLVLMVPVARLACVKAEDGEGTDHIFVKGIIVAVDVVRHLRKKVDSFA